MEPPVTDRPSDELTADDLMLIALAFKRMLMALDGAIERMATD